MVKKLTKECTTQYSKQGSGLIAVVTQVMVGENVSTTITLQCDEDYDYVSSEYKELLCEERIEQLVDIAFMQASKINKPASKYGDPVPEINENLSNIATLITEYRSMAEWHGKKVEVLGVIANPDDNSIIDPECMPKYHIRMIGKDTTNTADPYELGDFEDPRMEAALKGMNDDAPESDYSDELKQFYSWGKELVAYKG